MKTDIFDGYGWGKTQIGLCEDGIIYSGYGWRKSTIGSYANGDVYSGYGWGRSQVGSYSNGCVYSGYGWGRTQIGSYENDMSSFKNKDDILTALIHLGYLAYDENTQEVYIPNKEVQYTLEQQLKGEILS